MTSLDKDIYDRLLGKSKEDLVQSCFKHREKLPAEVREALNVHLWIDGHCEVYQEAVEAKKEASAKAKKKGTK